MTVEFNPLYELSTISLTSVKNGKVDPLNDLANNYFDQIRKQSSYLAPREAKWLSDKLHQLKPYLREENRVLFKELINQLSSFSEVAINSNETYETTLIRDCINKMIFEDGLDRWLHDETVTGNKAEAVKRIKVAYNTGSTSLDLSCLYLTALPPETGSLTMLRKLDIRNNNLESLPSQICKLTLLSWFYLNHNKLQTLPPQIGNLTLLSELSISNNPSLRELPMTLGNISFITHLNIENTKIPDSMRDAILASCREKMRNRAQIDLSSRLNLWVGFAGADTSLQFIMTDLETHQKRSIFEWLIRLEKAEDFKYNQQSLAEETCKMLATLKDNKEFRELFFIQIVPNLDRCQDRASMAFNEIYIAWRIHTMNPESSTKEKLQEMKGLVKTLVLRKQIAKRIAQRNALQTMEAGRKVEEGESVEIYLYYESQLKEELGLITAIKGMSYEEIGERDWIKKGDLVEAVKDGYLDEMVELPQFIKLLNAADDYQEPATDTKLYQKEIDDAYLELQNLDKAATNYQEKVNQLMLKVERLKIKPILDARKAWVEKHLLG